MSIIIDVYIILCVALLIFDIVFLLVQNRRSLVAYRTNKKLEKQILEEIQKREETGSFSPDFTDSLSKSLSKTKNLLTLDGVICEKPQTREWFRPVVFEQMSSYSSKSSSEQAYYTYLLSTFDYKEEKPSAQIIDSLIAFLDSKSLYTFTNTMMCLYAIGLTNPLLRAMDKINERQGFYHKKLLVDGLLSTQIETDELDKALMQKFDSYSPYTQDCLLDYFRIKGADASELCMRILSDGQADTQVGYSAMRFFVKFPSRESREYFMKLLADDSASWVSQLLAVQALRRYDDREVRDAMVKKATSPNWYIRTEAVQFLHDKGMTRDEILDFINMNDRYANESLLYQYRNDPEMAGFISEAIRALEEQEQEQKHDGDNGGQSVVCSSLSEATV